MDGSPEHIIYYRYDALGRRIFAGIESSALTDSTRYVYDGWRVIERRDSNNNVKAAIVYGSYIDDVVAMCKPGGSNEMVESIKT